MTTYEFNHTAQTTASPAAVFALWADVPGWPSWDSSVEKATLEGPFAAGTRGSMTLEGPMTIDFVLVEVTPDGGFLDETVMPDGHVLRFEHRVVGVGAGAEVSVRITIAGPNAEQMGPMVTSDTPDAVAGLIRLAERSTVPA